MQPSDGSSAHQSQATGLTAAFDLCHNSSSVDAALYHYKLNVNDLELHIMPDTYGLLGLRLLLTVGEFDEVNLR